jgi:hypothetical protein
VAGHKRLAQGGMEATKLRAGGVVLRVKLLKDIGGACR